MAMQATVTLENVKFSHSQYGNSAEVTFTSAGHGVKVEAPITMTISLKGGIDEAEVVRLARARLHDSATALVERTKSWALDAVEAPTVPTPAP